MTEPDLRHRALLFAEALGQHAHHPGMSDALLKLIRMTEELATQPQPCAEEAVRLARAWQRFIALSVSGEQAALSAPEKKLLRSRYGNSSAASKKGQLLATSV